ncbi:MAG: GNAT family N-acetyltransferase [Planctomycetes bacterium]|nr:GNAT family N-acetyltransferase [Planctomycetota bacterium]
MTEPHLWARPLQPEFADDFFKFHDRADCGGCWCMYWHFPGTNGEWGAVDKAKLREEKCGRIASQGDTGMILYEDKEPVGWCQFGARKHFPKLLERLKPPPGPDDLWCLNCFLIAPGRRRQGYARALLAITLEHLQRLGVKEVEAYPKPGQHEDGEVWMGPEKLFLDAGFTGVPGASGGAVVRKRLG